MTNGNFGSPPEGGSGQGFGAPPQGGGFGGPPQGGAFGGPPPGGGYGAPPQGGGFGGPPPGGGFGGPPPGGAFGGPPPGGAFGGPPPGGGAPQAAGADFSDALDVFKTLVGQLVPTGLLGGFLVMSVGSLFAQVPLWVSQYLRVRAIEELGVGNLGDLVQGNMLAAALSLLGAALMCVVFAARLGLARPMRMVVLAGPASVSGTGDVLRLTLGRLGPNLAVTFVYFVAVTIGSLFCLLPGLALAIALYPATYLVATERDFSSAFTLSINWVQRHAGALLGTAGVVIAIVLVMGCCNCGLSGLLTPRFGMMSGVYMMPFMWVVGEVFSMVAMLFLGSGCVAADRVESAALPHQLPAA